VPEWIDLLPPGLKLLGIVTVGIIGWLTRQVTMKDKNIEGLADELTAARSEHLQDLRDLYGRIPESHGTNRRQR
jgi:hypothetical protein